MVHFKSIRDRVTDTQCSRVDSTKAIKRIGNLLNANVYVANQTGIEMRIHSTWLVFGTECVEIQWAKLPGKSED